MGPSRERAQFDGIQTTAARKGCDLTMILYRPTGLRELRLVADSGYREFPPRLPDQPIFYPVLTLEYARQIARDWNTKSGDQAGFVTRFEVEDTFVARYPVQIAGGQVHQELWVPAAELPEFNRHILGVIVIVESYAGPQFSGRIDPVTHLPVGLDPTA